MAQKEYWVSITRYEPQIVTLEVFAENALDAKNIALKKVRDGDFEEAEIDTTQPVKYSLLNLKRIRR